jgi:hypothetical protein
MITCFKFKDIIDITYHSNDDTLYLSLSDGWLQENSLFKNSKDYMLEYEKRTTDNKEDLENNIVSVILKLYHEEDFCYISGCYIEHFISKFNKKIGVCNYDWNSYLRVFRKQPLLKFTKLIINNSDNIKDEYDVISFLYLMCKNPDFGTLENAGFKFVNMTGEN